jgi:hypothetical protein
VRIAGRFKGDINVRGDLTIENGAKVNGSVRAERVTIAGELTGNIETAAHLFRIYKRCSPQFRERTRVFVHLSVPIRTIWRYARPPLTPKPERRHGPVERTREILLVAAQSARRGPLRRPGTR